jgi:hypothetical protein
MTSGAPLIKMAPPPSFALFASNVLVYIEILATQEKMAPPYRRKLDVARRNIEKFQERSADHHSSTYIDAGGVRVEG